MALVHSSSNLEPAWTPRQRQVLQLLVRGRTNGQIADELGISLDGAKWHVSEIITKLGVDSREDAAEYWRARNGLRLRFTRLLNVLTPAPIWAKVLGAGAVIAAAGVAAVVITVMLQEAGSDSAAEPSAIATPVPTTDPAPTGTALPATTPEVIDGVTVQSLKLGTDVQLPRGVVLYYNVLGYATDGGVANPVRVYRTTDGTLVRDHIFANLPNVGTVFTMSTDYDRQEFAVGVCTHGHCGGHAAPDADSTAMLYRSNDGGMSWTEGGPLARGSMIAAVLPQGVAVTNWDGTSPAYTYTLLPQDVPLKPPTGQPYPVNLGGGEWGWFEPTSGTLTSSDGSKVLWQRPAGLNGYVVGRAGDDVVTAWSGVANQPYDIQPWNSYIGTTDANGKLINAASYPGSADVRAVRAVSPEALVGNVGVDASGQMSTGMASHFHVALIDLDTGQVHPVPEISDGLAGFNNGKNEHAFVLGAMVGNFARVNAGGDCLNVRESASTNAKSLGCFKDGVLLRLIEDGSAGSNGWAHVATPAGQPGWASTEFVET